MGVLSVLAAAAIAWIFGAIWYGLIGKQWMAASGLTEESINRKDMTPYIVSFICCVLVAGMFRHVLSMAGIETLGKSILTGFGIGLFIVAPWMVTNVMFAMRDRALIWMDGVYPVIGMALMGLVFALF